MSNLADIAVFKTEAENRMSQIGLDKITVAKEISFALQLIDKSKQLQECTPESKLKAVVNIAQVGLTLNPVSKEAHLVPRWNKQKGGFEAALEPSYVGLCKLLTDAGSVTSILCNVVYEKDKIEINVADNQQPVKHQPELVRANRGKLIGAYALATLSNGNRQVEWMDVDTLKEIRERSETYSAFKAGKIKTCTWETDYAEMCRKTVLRRIYKYLPRTERMEAIDNAISLDNADYTATEEQMLYIEHLMDACGYEDKEKQFKMMEARQMPQPKVSALIDKLKEQAELIWSNPDMNPRASQKDIKNHIAKL